MKLRGLLVTVSMGCRLLASEPYIKIGILGDETGSAVSNSTPALLPADITPFVDLIRARGGQIAVCVVTARAQGGMVRLTVEPPSAKPQAPNLNVNVFEQREQLKSYQIALGDWKAREAKRTQDADNAIRTFEAQLQTVLVGTRTERRSDVWGALLRMDRFLMEELPLPGYTTEPFALIASDLQNTAGGQRYAMASQPKVAWVNRIVRTGPIIFSAPHLFENIDPAVRWIVNQAQEGAR